MMPPLDGIVLMDPGNVFGPGSGAGGPPYAPGCTDPSAAAAVAGPGNVPGKGAGATAVEGPDPPLGPGGWVRFSLTSAWWCMRHAPTPVSASGRPVTAAAAPSGGGWPCTRRKLRGSQVPGILHKHTSHRAGQAPSGSKFI